MDWKVSIRSQAESDLRLACEWYDRIDTELGDRFLDEVANAIEELKQFPDFQTLYYLNFRRILLKQFPYKLFYRIVDNRVIVFRVLHVSQCHEVALQ